MVLKHAGPAISKLYQKHATDNELRKTLASMPTLFGSAPAQLPAATPDAPHAALRKRAHALMDAAPAEQLQKLVADLEAGTAHTHAKLLPTTSGEPVGAPPQ